MLQCCVRRMVKTVCQDFVALFITDDNFVTYFRLFTSECESKNSTLSLVWLNATAVVIRIVLSISSMGECVCVTWYVKLV